MYDEISANVAKEWRDLLLLHKFAVDELKVKLENLDEEFRLIQDYNPIEHIRYRVKKPQSIIEKLQRIGLEPTIANARNNIFDIAGIRIICAFTADIYRIAEILKNRPEINVVKVKDYIEKPKQNGYMSLHLHVEYPVSLSTGTELVRVEIQIRTIAMDFWASIEHKIYYRYREKAPRDIQAELKGCADMVMNLDDRMYNLKRIIDALEYSGIANGDKEYKQDKKKVDFF